MDKRLLTSIILFVTIGAGTYFARHMGWYNSYWYTDVILHFIAGIMFGCFWLWLIRRGSLSPLITYISLTAFAVLGCVLWEFWEFGGHTLFPAKTVYYIPVLSDTLGDIACGLGGAVLLAALLAIYDKIKK